MKSFMRSYCTSCDHSRPFQKQGASNILHLLLSIVTAGLWLPIWLLCGLSAVLKPYHCPQCGERHRVRRSWSGKVEFDPSLVVIVAGSLAMILAIHFVGG